MALDIVRDLKVRGFEAESSALLSDMSGKTDLTTMGILLLGDIRVYPGGEA